MNSDSELQLLCSLNDPGSLLVIKVSVFAEYIAVVGEILFLDLRKHLINDQIDIIISLALVFGGYVMSAKEGWNDFNLTLVLLLELIDNLE
jgi:hypothetical protein